MLRRHPPHTNLFLLTCRSLEPLVAVGLSTVVQFLQALLNLSTAVAVELLVTQELHQRFELEVCQPLVLVGERLAKGNLFCRLCLDPTIAVRFDKLVELPLVCQFVRHIDVVHVFHQHGHDGLPVLHLHHGWHDVNLFHAGFLKTLRCLQVVGCQLDTTTAHVAEPDRRLGLHHA